MVGTGYICNSVPGFESTLLTAMCSEAACGKDLELTWFVG